MAKRVAALILAALCIGAVTVSLITRSWWRSENRTFHTSYGIQSMRACDEGEADCDTVRYVAYVAGLGELRRKADAAQAWDDDSHKTGYMKDLGRLERFASTGLVAAIAGLFLMLGAGLGALLAYFKKAGGARIAGWIAVLAGVAGLAMAFLFYRAEPFSAGRVERGREPLAAGVGFPLYAGGAVAGVAAGLLAARTRPRWQEIAEEDAASPDTGAARGRDA